MRGGGTPPTGAGRGLVVGKKGLGVGGVPSPRFELGKHAFPGAPSGRTPPQGQGRDGSRGCRVSLVGLAGLLLVYNQRG